MTFFVEFHEARPRAVLLCSPDLVLGSLTAAAVEPSGVRVEVASNATEAYMMLDAGAHYRLVVIDRSLGATAVERIRRHPLAGALMVIEFEGTSTPDEPVSIARALAERQAQLLAPSIVESLQPVRAAAVVH